MRRQYASRAFAAGLFSSCALLLGCVQGNVGTAVQSSTGAALDAGPGDAGTCPADCQALGRVCHPRRLVCVECLEDIDCPRATPLCSFGRCSVCTEDRDHDGVCDFDPRCPGPGRDCDVGNPGQRSGRFGGDPDDRGPERNPSDAGP